MFKIPATIRGQWHLTRITQTVAIFPKLIFTTLWQTIRRGSPNVRQLFGTFRQGVAKNLKLYGEELCTIWQLIGELG